MYTKIKKATITLSFLLALSATNYAATITDRASKHLYQPAAKHMQKQLARQISCSKAMASKYAHSKRRYRGAPLSKNHLQRRLASQIVPNKKRLSKHASSEITTRAAPQAKSKNYPWKLLGTARTKKSHRTRTNLKYKLGITAGIASIIAVQVYLNRAKASGYRGDGYRPYDCEWGPKFEKQAKKALKNADLFKRLCRIDKLDKETKKKIGTSVLVALLWAQDQGKNLFKNHHDDCNESYPDVDIAICHREDENSKLMDKYYKRLDSEIDTIRDLIGVPHPLGWEEQVPHFLYGGIKSGVLIGVLGKTMAVIPVLQPIALGAGAVYGLYKGIQWLDKNVVNPERGLAEEEAYIKQELFVRALCADEYSIKQAQNWGSYTVTAIFIMHGVVDGLTKLVGEAEALEVIEVLEAEEIAEEALRWELVELEASAGGSEAALEKKFEETISKLLAELEVKYPEGVHGKALEKVLEEAIKRLGTSDASPQSQAALNSLAAALRAEQEEEKKSQDSWFKGFFW